MGTWPTNWSTMRIHYIYERMAHHATHSGYDRIVGYIDGDCVGHNALYRILGMCPERVLARLRRTAGTWYNSYALRQELQNIPAFIFSGNQTFHFLYGDDAYHYSGYFNPRRSNKLVATFHNPPDKFLNITPATRHLKTLDAAVIVAPNQQELFCNLVRPGRVHLIPHGVDTRFFSPAPGAAKKKQCLFVGTHLRDFAMLRRIIAELNSKAPDIAFVVVTFREHFHFFDGLKNVTALSAISESQLLKLYTESELLLLPLVDATANNAILEAMACGLPVVTTDVGGISLYTGRQGAILVERGDVSAMRDEALRILHDEETRRDMARAARAQAETFDWPAIAGQLRRLYEQLYG
ncbi:MAG: glycosyltransferase family 4 protein [Deltaproteobacteria bacterium]|nr:glycosyltransferase family 4 protein [Deltaproteobacteria bacterium]